MQYCDVMNHNHDDKCPLWFNRYFWDGEYKWDSQIQRLVIDFKMPAPDASHAAHTPWEHAEDYVWDGDNPIISVSEAIDRMETKRDETDNQVCALEEEAFEAYLKSGDDEYGWVQLPDGSWADQDSRVTYRISKDDQGKDCWYEEYWDGEPVAVEAFCDCIPVKQYFCATHKVKRNNPNSPWEHDTYNYNNNYKKCDHTFDRFILPNAENHADVDIRISGARRHTEDTTPDLGIYAANCWNPDSVAMFIPWTDYGLPTCSFTVASRTLQKAWAAALDGEVVEFGCMGGHGRTGTMLACMAILADPTMSGDEAVAHVRKVHCTKAVESSQQEWFVRWFAANVRDLPFSEAKPTASSWSAYDDDWGYGSDQHAMTPKTTGTQSYPATTRLEDVINDSTVEYTEILPDRTITKYKSGKLVTEYKTGGMVTTYVKRTAPDSPVNDGNPGSTCVWGEHCRIPQCNFYHPKAVTPTTSPAAGSWTPDGNVAPGATANARRNAAKRARRAEAAKRAKQKRNRQYVNSRTN